ncbi:MAG TPA: TonB-dependent receptor, partial [Acidobacteriota bacterium]
SWKNALTQISAYRLRYRLNLFSNFTYFLNDPVNGDQFEQSDNRNVSGVEMQQRWLGGWFDRNTENQIGLRVRNDDIDAVGLFRTNQRRRLETVRLDRIAQTNWSAYWQNATTWSAKFRTIAGLRTDYFSFDVQSNLAANSDTTSDGIISPKLGFVLGPWRKTEFYVNYGTGFHSNDARGITIRLDPVTLLPAQRVPALVRSKGGEWGLRAALMEKWQSTFSLWVLDFDSELLFSGDAGSTEASRASRRTGFEWNNYFKPYRWMTAEVNWAYSRSRFRGHPEAGDRIPGAVEGVFTGGIWLEGLPLRLNPFQHTVGVIQTRAKPETVIGNSFWSNLILGLQLRYFGPRPLIEDNSVRAKSSTLVNLAIGYKLNRKWNGFLDIFNVLNSESSDIDYYYLSRLPGEPLEGAADIHTHPVEPLSFRFSVTRNF